ncbi:hypothetical protein, partial [Microbulbifer sp. 2205BS26-8]|uniref:hypothetical protein n=1 Tax=Microbulbifer sp. 2205BS26-8 TaxID=3064386 RepID=UPI00273ED414
MRLFLIVLLMLSNAVFAAMPLPPSDEWCRSNPPTPVSGVTLPTSDADGSYALTFKLLPDQCIRDVSIFQSRDGGSYSHYDGYIYSHGSFGSITVNLSGQDSAVYRYRIRTVSRGGY